VSTLDSLSYVNPHTNTKSCTQCLYRKICT